MINDVINITTPKVTRIEYSYDKFRQRNGATFFYKIDYRHRPMLEKLLNSFDLDETDNKMLRQLMRTGEYSEHQRERLSELRKMYIEDFKSK